MAFPRQRLRRLRQTENLRKMVRETTLSSDDFIYPLFAVHGKGIKKRDSFHAGELSAVY